MFTVPPNRKHESWIEIQCGQFIDGKLVELWISADRFDLFEQLGIVPQSQWRIYGRRSVTSERENQSGRLGV